MKHNLCLLALGLLVFAGCRSNPHKAEKIETKLEGAEAVSGTEKVGLKNGEMVVLDKVQMSEKLRDLQNGVYGLEDKVYGTRKLGSLGQYGELKACRRKLASRQYGGSGSMVWTEPLDRVTDKEDELKVGLDEKKELVGVSEEYLKDRIQRFQTYKMILQKRSDEFQEKIDQCNQDVAAKELDANQSSKVMVTDVPKGSIEKPEVNKFMCGFVRENASLESFMMNAFAKGWLALADFHTDQNIIAASLKDTKGESKDNVMLFNGWKLSFDKGPITVGELLKDGKDAHLQAWAFDKKNDPSVDCLKKSGGEWNP
jgi:hypothetical protein